MNRLKSLLIGLLILLFSSCSTTPYWTSTQPSDLPSQSQEADQKDYQNEADLLPPSASNLKIVFSTPGETEDDMDIAVINADGTGFTRLTNSSGWNTNPVWSKDGSKIYFISSGNRLVSISSDGSKQTGINYRVNVNNFSISPFGDKIAYEAVSSNNDLDIFISSIDGQGLANLTSHAQRTFCPHGLQIIWI